MKSEINFFLRFVKRIANISNRISNTRVNLIKNQICNFRKYGLKGLWENYILKVDESPLQKSKAIALGLFIGLTPLIGLHTILILFFATFFRLNKSIALVASSISIAPLFPFVAYAEYWIGSKLWYDDITIKLSFDQIKSGDAMLKGGTQYIVGSLVVAIVVSVSVALLFYFLIKRVEKK